MSSGARWWGALVASLALAALAARAQQPAQPGPTRVYNIVLERARDVERVLVFGDRPLTPRLEQSGPDQLVLHLEGAALDPAAPAQLVAGAGSALRELRAVAIPAPNAEVQLQISLAAGVAAPQISQRDLIVALEFARPPEQAERGAPFRLVDRPLSELVREVTKQTGQRFLIDERLQGNATVIVAEPVTPGEALEILHSTLVGKGFAAVPTPSGVFAVVPIEEGRTRAPKKDGAPRADRAGLITTLARFESVDCQTLASVLQPAAGTAITVVTYPPTNAVILVGSEGPVHRWLELARALDEIGSVELAVIQPRHRSAAELFPLLEAALLDPLTGRPRAELWLDARANALIARGAQAPLAALRAQLAELDVAPEIDGEVAVIRPRFADPEKLAEILRGVAEGAEAADPEALVLASALTGRRLDVAVHPSSRALVVSADTGTLRLVRDVVEKLDREPPSIELELHVVEIATTGRVELGVDFFIPTADPAKPGNIVGIAVNDPLNPSAAIGFGRYARTPVIIPVFDPSGNPLPPIILPREIVDVTASAGNVFAQSVLRPHLMASSGEEQELVAGVNVPVLSATAPSAEGAGGDALTTRIDVERQDVGLRLRVKPVAGEAGDVRLTVDVEVSNLRPAPPGVRADLGPVIGKRTLHANTVVAPGGAAVLGMLLDQSWGSSESGPPFLTDVPAFGTLLKETRDESARSHLLIAIQAHKLRGSDERIADAIRLRTAHERALARRGALRQGEASWALLIGTRTRREDAEALAVSVGEVAGHSAAVIPWKWDEAERFDVVVPGFARVVEAVEALSALEAAGRAAQLVPVSASGSP